MGVKLQLVLGIILAVSTCIRQSFSAEYSSTTLAYNERNINLIEKLPKTDPEFKFIDKTPIVRNTNNSDIAKTSEPSNQKIRKNEVEKDGTTNSSITKDAEKKRDESSRSINIDRYGSPEFQNNVFTLPVSSDTEKYLEEPFAFKSSSTGKGSDFANFDLTTPRTAFFDNKFTEAIQKLEQEYEENRNENGDDHDSHEHEHGSHEHDSDEHAGHELEHDHDDDFTEEDLPSVDKMRGNIEEAPKNVSVNYKAMKILKNNTADKLPRQNGMTVVQVRKIDFISNFNDTKVYSYDSKGDSDNLSSTTPKAFIVTTRKSVTLTKPPVNKNNSHILSNRIETETIKAINVHLTETTTAKGDIGDLTQQPRHKEDSVKNSSSSPPKVVTLINEETVQAVITNDDHALMANKREITTSETPTTVKITTVPYQETTTDSTKVNYADTKTSADEISVPETTTKMSASEPTTEEENPATTTIQYEHETIGKEKIEITTEIPTTALPTTEIQTTESLSIETGTTEPQTSVQNDARETVSLETLIFERTTETATKRQNDVTTENTAETTTLETTSVTTISPAVVKEIENISKTNITTVSPVSIKEIENSSKAIVTNINIATATPATTAAEKMEITTIKPETRDNDMQNTLRHAVNNQTSAPGIPKPTSEIPTLLPTYPSTAFPDKERNVVYESTNETTAEETYLPTETSSVTDDITGNSPGEGSGKVVAIVVSTVGAVCLVLLAVILYVMRRRQKRFNYIQNCRPVSLDDYKVDNVSVYSSVRRKGAARQSKRSYGNPAFDDPGITSHPLSFPALAKFASSIEEIKAEFEDIPQISASISELPEGCEIKNRYANVIPLPETRVFLKPLEGMPNSDYINANYVTGPKNAKGYYIACQSPKQNTVDDFWRMIWEQNTKVILMITHLFESGQEKCADYLPPSEVSDCHRLFGDYQVTLKKRDVKEKYITSKLQLKNMVSNSWREVTHFWYLGWPDKGVPATPNSLITFLIESRSYMKTATLDKNLSINGIASEASSSSDLNPVVVHCSPGTGRTGVVIACDIAIREFEQARLVDIPKIVYRIRRDRAGAVQTKDQYIFIYKVISLYATKLTGGALDSF